ncbi:hypothetical protein [Absidia glauca]|uniref:Uncharacterized protein n=1 Tax=Absidia glauca TaxID=4829 RepID=A0A163JZC0_ABSGL|nr:hypothetical protein [Absidia glauca]
MRFNTALISIVALATTSLVQAVPIDKRDEASASDVLSTKSVPQPSYTASANNAHYSAVASISILGPDGQPLHVGGSTSTTSDATSVGTFVASYVLLPAAITGYILM